MTVDAKPPEVNEDVGTELLTMHILCFACRDILCRHRQHISPPASSTTANISPPHHTCVTEADMAAATVCGMMIQVFLLLLHLGTILSSSSTVSGRRNQLGPKVVNTDINF
ncbi:hypothetical protein L798_02396 [Zootermopsis nevadensis]|uniref:Uncharacterized protein n=1 Tax=Zootermopsis nevadensis TaxID=136037 RepID=A0A067RRA8_ZOONE|nr:hypothetical protein L798_02396 [Zootermopsis nevadensis]